MMKRVLLAAAVVAALAGGSSALALAQGPPAGPGMPGAGRGPRGAGPRLDFGLRGIELTDAQREQVRSIAESHQAEFEEAGRKLREAHRAFAAATQASSVDEAAVRARSTALASAMADEALLRAKVRSEVHRVLTTEQQQQLRQRREAIEKRLQDRQQRLPERGRGR